MCDIFAVMGDAAFSLNNSAFNKMFKACAGNVPKALEIWWALTGMKAVKPDSENFR